MGIDPHGPGLESAGHAVRVVPIVDLPLARQLAVVSCAATIFPPAASRLVPLFETLGDR